MTKQEKIKLFKQLYALEKKSQEFLDALPASVSAAFFDNECTAALWSQTDLMRRAIFGRDLAAVEWFFYEWTPGSEVGYGDTTAAINSMDEYIDWIVNVEGFGEE